MKNTTENRARQDQSRRFEDVFLGCHSGLKRLVSRYLHRPQDVEDVVQEVFIRSYQVNINKKIDQPKGYMFRTARNLSLKHLDLSHNRLTDAVEDLDIPEVTNSEDPVFRQVEVSEQFAIFCEAARELPEQCRKVFILKKVYELSHDEIADRLSISVSTTNQHLAKGVARVTEYMREHGYLSTGHSSMASSGTKASANSLGRCTDGKLSDG
ncbi:MAG: RNA polymerase sigma factor [Proteobacteria bacterium]|nr:RNA polymerase sigma factor [Pseudomonadota bacterium]